MYTNKTLENNSFHPTISPESSKDKIRSQYTRGVMKMAEVSKKLDEKRLYMCLATRRRKCMQENNELTTKRRKCMHENNELTTKRRKCMQENNEHGRPKFRCKDSIARCKI